MDTRILFLAGNNGEFVGIVQDREIEAAAEYQK